MFAIHVICRFLLCPGSSFFPPTAKVRRMQIKLPDIDGMGIMKIPLFQVFALWSFDLCKMLREQVGVRSGDGAG